MGVTSTSKFDVTFIILYESYNKLLNYFHCLFRITSYNVCYTKLLRVNIWTAGNDQIPLKRRCFTVSESGENFYRCDGIR